MRHLTGLTIVALALLLPAGPGLAAHPGNPAVAWTPSSLTVTLDPGDNTSTSASFSSSKPLSSVKAKAVPGIGGLVTPSPASFASVSAGSPRTVNLAVSVPADTAPGIYTGAIQISASGKNQPKPLPVTIRVQGVTSLTTALSATSINTGASVTDQATISGAAASAAGTISYRVYTTSDCSGSPYADATPSSNTVTNASAPASNPVTFTDPGTYYWQASYSGDPATATLPSTSSCSSETLTVTTPTSSCPADGTIGCPWQNGDLTSYTEADWGDTPNGTNAASLLQDNYGSVYPSSLFEIGISGTAGYSIRFIDASYLLAYLPSAGTPGPLDADLLDPTSSSSGAFGGDVAALKLDVDFSDAGLLPASSGLKFGDLTLCNFTAPTTDINGISVRDFLGIVNTALGGGTTTDGITDLDTITAQLNFSFFGGTPSDWAQQHLENGACGWHTGDLTTVTPDEWGTGGSANATLWNDYDSVYASTVGIFLIGSTSGYYAKWTDLTILSTYLPPSGTAAALTASLLNPLTTASGVFGGDVAALKLTIDFADAGFIGGNSGLKLGDLTICGLTDEPDLNGKSVRDFLAVANTALAGIATTDSIAQLNDVTAYLDVSFDGGIPTTWAQDHLVDGSCP
jgi:hypothetical protein